MNITELIEELRMLLSEFGDLEVVLPQGCDFDAEEEDGLVSCSAEISIVETAGSGVDRVAVIY